MILSDAQILALRALVDELAIDNARLGHHVADEYGVHLLGREAHRLEVMDAILRPTASQIYRANIAFDPTDEALAAECALEDVDARARALRRLLGVTR